MKPWNAFSADLFLNSACNLSCRTCFLGDKYFDNRSEMSVQNIKDILKWCSGHGIQDIALLGGEPTLHRDIEEIVTLPQSFDIKTTRLVTNGNKRFRMLLERLSMHVNIFYLSIDGPDQKTNDSVRGFGSFDDIGSTINLLDGGKHKYVITYTATSSKIEPLIRMIEFASKTKCIRLNIHLPTKVGRAKDFSFEFDPSEWLETLAQAKLHAKSRSNLIIDIQVGYSLRGEISKSTAQEMCRTKTRSNIQFMPDGRVICCGLLADNYTLPSFRWDGDDVKTLISKVSECTICDGSDSACPMRTEFDLDYGQVTEELIPICIYERLEV